MAEMRPVEPPPLCNTNSQKYPEMQDFATHKKSVLATADLEAAKS